MAEGKIEEETDVLDLGLTQQGDDINGTDIGSGFNTTDVAATVHVHLVLIICAIAVEISTIYGEGHDNQSGEAVCHIKGMGIHVDKLGIFIFIEIGNPAAKLHVTHF